MCAFNNVALERDCAANKFMIAKCFSYVEYGAAQPPPPAPVMEGVGVDI
jgi:hypothetical protein